MSGTLYVVATPIGNLEDLSLRALRLLKEASVIYAEDTRHSRVLLDHYGVTQPLRSLHEHNEKARVAEVIASLTAGKAVALLTDAGTPAVSDPGAALVADVAREGLPVSPLPGASALTAALSIAGFSGVEEQTAVLFVGFLAAKGRARQEALERIREHRGLVVLFEAPHRLAETLADLAAAEPERAACACRELTKVHEEARRGSLAELCAWATSAPVKGELTLVLGPVLTEPIKADEAAVDKALVRCLEAGLSPRDAATAVAAVLELPRRLVYGRCLALRP
jgi:16S rRNA (cytidine1402-2'-O)-methyltransferase